MSRGHFRKKSQNTGLNITSMMDMMTIILLFLLKSFSADGSVLTNADNLQLPNSISSKRPEELPLQVAVTTDAITVDNVPVMVTETLWRMDPDDFDEDTTSAFDLSLKVKMEQQQELLRIGAIKEPGGEIIVQLDKNINFDIMYKVMRVCGRQGFVNMKFAVMMREE
jgi:biopolymer transport protein ExbD